jgi:hypothetical protein
MRGLWVGINANYAFYFKIITPYLFYSPRNQFSAVDPVAAQTASPNQRPPVSYEDETEVQPFTRVPVDLIIRLIYCVNF